MRAGTRCPQRSKGRKVHELQEIPSTPVSPMIEAPASALLRIEDLTVHFPVGRIGFGRRRDVVHALDGVSLELARGETLGLVGESGSGKSTIAQAVLGLHKPTSGRIEFEGDDIARLGRRALRRRRRNFQIVFQDPATSLNPRMKVGAILAEPLLIHGLVSSRAAAAKRVAELLELCELPQGAASRYPHTFSGGQQQRIAIARALSLEPKLIVADEPTSALDVSIQAQIVNLMADLQERLGLSYLLISHDLAVVRELAHRVAVLYAGKLFELAPAEAIYERPNNPYTKALLSASPIPDPTVERTRSRIVLHGEIPNPINPPSGCRFHTRCPLAQDVCRRDEPPLEEKHPGQWSACWFT
jgi:oligopeptide/dipeptide ABC transporter ATP-binding protein